MNQHCIAYAEHIARNWPARLAHLIDTLSWGEIRSIVDLRIHLFGAR